MNNISKSSVTPNKNKDHPVAQEPFSPVVLHQNPAAVSPSVNITGVPRVARDIAADIHNNIQQWNEHHVNGAKLVREAALCKSETKDTYPEGLDKIMKDLYDIVKKLSVISNALIFLSNQMKALIKLQKQANPIFISLTIEQLAELSEVVAEAYKSELKEKENVLENIAHSKAKDEVMFYAASWTHQIHITNNVSLKLETILTETGHRKIK